MDIKIAVAERISNAGPHIAQRVIDIMAEETLKKRVNSIVSAQTEADNLTRQIRRTKPDMVGYNESGIILSAAFSKKGLGDRNILVERLAKIERAITLALEKGDWTLMDKLGGKDGNKTPAPDVADDAG